ncbi:hypothetical protein ACQP00_29945 [Dactylosporangium sp. CS-047395]|uniref:hypothetical protein n=1 Tax=Dactylosporangium sp. CS-047395 TaxID=3239936 RepID=UPI003D8B7253
MAQITLPGQAATAEGPNDLIGMFTMHWAFRRDLDRFAAAVARTPVADREVWRALERRWALFAWVLHELPAPAVRSLPAPPPLRWIWRAMLRGPFTRRERVAFRYA